jgi:hypothetical protein
VIGVETTIEVPGRMTGEQRRALEAEQDGLMRNWGVDREAHVVMERVVGAQRWAYGNGVLQNGPDAYLTRVTGGWTVRSWDGSRVPGVFRTKKQARAQVEAQGRECRAKAQELGARLECERLDETLAEFEPPADLDEALRSVYGPGRRRWGAA